MMHVPLAGNKARRAERRLEGERRFERIVTGSGRAALYDMRCPAADDYNDVARHKAPADIDFCVFGEAKTLTAVDFCTSLQKIQHHKIHNMIALVCHCHCRLRLCITKGGFLRL